MSNENFRAYYAACINAGTTMRHWHVILYACITLTVNIAIFLTALLIFFFFRRTSAPKKGLGSTAQIEFLSLKATTLVGRGSPSLVLRPFRSTIEGEEDEGTASTGGDERGGSSGQEMKGVVWGDRKI